MKTLQETIDAHFEANSTYLSDHAKKVDDFDGLGLSDIAHNHSDSCEDVIYYGKAHKLIASVSMTEQGEAESMVDETGGHGEGVSYDQMACNIAYWITYNSMIETLTEEKDELVSAIEEYAEQLENHLFEIDEDGSEYEYEIQERLEAAEDFINTLESL